MHAKKCIKNDQIKTKRAKFDKFARRFFAIIVASSASKMQIC